MHISYICLALLLKVLVGARGSDVQLSTFPQSQSTAWWLDRELRDADDGDVDGNDGAARRGAAARGGARWMNEKARPGQAGAAKNFDSD